MDPAGAKSGASRRYIMSAVEASLRRLQDRLDRSVSSAHARSRTRRSKKRSARSTISMTQGKDPLRRAVRISPRGKCCDAVWTAKSSQRHAVRLVPGRVEFARARRRARTRAGDGARTASACLPYFPLASGLLSGKYRGGAKPAGARLTTTKQLIDLFVNDDEHREGRQARRVSPKRTATRRSNSRSRGSWRVRRSPA